MPETDETKWVGIQGIVPPENIPVDIRAATVWIPIRIDPLGNSVTVSPETAGTIFKVSEQSPLAQIKVEPLAAGTEFKTLTEKRSPSVADMQAVKRMERLYVNETKTATPHNWDATTVNADEILIVNMVYATYSGVTVTSISANVRINMPPWVSFPFAYWPHTAGWEVHTWFGALPVNEGEVIRITWMGGGAGGTVIGALLGFIVPKYT